MRVHVARTRRLNAAVDTLELPEGLTSRPLTMDDARAVYEVMARQEQHDLGKVEIEPADIVGDWQKPSFDIGASTVGVFDGAALIAYAEVNQSGRGDAAVDPSYRRRGLGTTLAAWMRARTGELGGTVIGTPVPEGSAGDRLLEKLGWQIRWTSWVLRAARGGGDPGPHPARGLRDPRGRTRGVPRGPDRDRGRVPRVVGARPRDVRRLPGHDRPAPRLRAVALPGGHRRFGPSSSAPHWSRSTASRRSRPSSAGSPYAATSDTEASPRRCSWTRSPGAGSTARTARPSPPTPARVRSSLYQKVGMEVGDVWVNRFSEV